MQQQQQWTGTDPHLVLLSLTGLKMTPAQMLMGRTLRSTLPCSSALLKQSTSQHVHSRIQDLQSRQRLYHNQNSKPLPALDPGTTVHMQTWRDWEPAIVTGQRREPCSYNLLTPAGKALRRNRRHLRKIYPGLFRDTDLDEDSEVTHPQTHGSPDLPPQDPPPQVLPPVNVNSSPAYCTKSGRAVRCPVRFRD